MFTSGAGSAVACTLGGQLTGCWQRVPRWGRGAQAWRQPAATLARDAQQIRAGCKDKVAILLAGPRRRVG